MIPDSRNTTPTSESIILDILSKKTRLPIKELYNFFIKKYNRSMTIQGFYKIIRQMVKNRILVKDSGLVSIDVSWIHNLLDFSEMLKQTYFRENTTLANILIEEGEEKEYVFDNVIDMDNFWNHALITVIHYYYKNEHKDKNVYNYNHHSWFQLVRVHSEKALGEAYRHMGLKWYLASGSKSFLDSLVGQNIDLEDFYYTQIEKGEIIKENYYVVVIGDYIFEAKLPKYIFELMENIYREVVDITKFNASEIESLINEPAKTHLVIFRNKKKAQQIRLSIKKFF